MIENEIRKEIRKENLITFVNSRSGGKQGIELLKKLGEILDKERVYDLALIKPNEILEKYLEKEKSFDILVCGGDGTVSWILEELDNFHLIDAPSVAILPLGTGNDLARTLNWGGGYEGSEDLEEIMRHIYQSQKMKLDRWQLSLTPLSIQTLKPIKTSTYVMNNYYSIGVDAKVAKGFHDLREGVPDLCSTRLGNKIWYALGGFKAIFEDFAPLDKVMELHVDAKPIKLLPDLSGLMVINIPSYAGGANLWGKDENSSQEFYEFERPSICDGTLEVVGITGSFHMGACTVSLSRAIRIAQGSTVSIYVKDQETMPMQMDGEPWLQTSPFALHFRHKNTANMLSKSIDPNISEEPTLVQKILDINLFK